MLYLISLCLERRIVRFSLLIIVKSKIELLGKREKYIKNGKIELLINVQKSMDVVVSYDMLTL